MPATKYVDALAIRPLGLVYVGDSMGSTDVFMVAADGKVRIGGLAFTVTPEAMEHLADQLRYWLDTTPRERYMLGTEAYDSDRGVCREA